MSAGNLCDLEHAKRAPSTVVAAALADALRLTSGERAQLFAEAIEGAGRGHPRRTARAP